MTIGIDIDDTITDSYDLIIKSFAKNTNKDLDYIKKKKMSYKDLSETYDDFIDFTIKYYETIIPHVKVKEDAKEVIDELHKLGFKIVIVTARNNNEYQNPYQISYDYLKEKQIYFDKLYVSVSEKGAFCKEHHIDYLIDDSIRNLTSAESSGLKTILFNNIYNNTNKFTRANSWLEVLNILKEIKN